jgi:hypothetical protein
VGHRLLNAGRDCCDELQAVPRIGEAPFGKRLSCLHREHRARKVWIFLCRTARGELFVSAPACSFVLGGEPLGFFGTPLHTSCLRILIEPSKGDPITDAHVRRRL